MIAIRRVKPEEADTLTQIALAAKRYWDYPDAWIQKWTPLLTFTPKKIEEADVFVAVMPSTALRPGDDKLAGFYRLFLRRPRATLEDLWVKPEFIGKGIGRALFDHASMHCRSAGVEYLAVEADPHAQGFYEKMGMRKIGEHPSDVDDQRALPILEMRL